MAASKEIMDYFRINCYNYKQGAPRMSIKPIRNVRAARVECKVMYFIEYFSDKKEMQNESTGETRQLYHHSAEIR